MIPRLYQKVINTVNKHPPLFLLLLLALPALACSLNANLSGPPALPSPTAAHLVITPSPALNVSAETLPTPAPPRCTVRTGQPLGRLTIRACAGLACAPLGYAPEGQDLVILSPTPTEWLHVQAGSLQGWVHSTYCKVNP